MSQDDDKQLSPEAKVARQTAPAFNALSQLVSSVIAFSLIGYGLDHFGVTPKGQGMIWGPVIGGVIGLAVFSYSASKIKSTQTRPPPPGDQPPSP